MTIMTVMSVSSHRGLGERQHTAGGRRRRVQSMVGAVDYAS